MRNLIRFSGFLNEKAGVPPGAIQNAERLAKITCDKIKELVGEKTAILGEELKFLVEPIGSFPAGTIYCELFVNGSDQPNIYVNGSVDLADSFEIVYGKSNTFTCKMKLSVFIPEPILKRLFTTNVWTIASLAEQFKSVEEDLTKNIESTIAHEFNHIYEMYVRKTISHQDSWITDLETLVYSKIYSFLNPKHAPPPIRKFFFYVYAAQAHEVAARTTQAFSLVREIPDPHKRLEVIKGSFIWQIAKEMMDFNAEEMFLSLEKIGWEAQHSKYLTDNIEKLLINSNTKAGAYLQSRHMLDTKTSREIFTKKRIRSVANSIDDNDFKKFVRRFQGIINRAGEKSFRKLSKVLTAEQE